ncbi:MAG: sulfotransferase [Roseinatronobacter sp.]
MSEDATHMICMGATKAGTSWLHAYLRGHPDCALRSIKELHYFDTVASGRYDAQIAMRRQALDALTARPETEMRTRAARMQDLRDWIAVLEERRENIAAYLGYLDAGRAARRVVADVTPAYGLLSVPMLRRIASMASDVRVIYLLRDPVARLWSQLRMRAARKADTMSAISVHAHQLMDKALAGKQPKAVARGDYAATCQRLDAAIAPDRLLVLFQEELFSTVGLQRLARFLGIAYQPADLAARVHAGVPVPLDPVRQMRAADMLKSQYDYVAQRFGGLPDSWQRSLAREGLA